MKVSINKDTGLMIESQSDSAQDETLLNNALSYGFQNVEIKIVSEVEHDALIAARDAVTG